MSKSNLSPSGAALSGLVLDLFRANNRLIAGGDRLVAGIGLSSARWKVMGSIAAARQPQPVAWLARDMGGKRQNVQRIVNDLLADALVALRPNPHHRRAQLVVLTAAGEHALAEAMRLQAPWIDGIADGLDPAEIAIAHRVLAAVCRKLEGEDEADTPE